MRTSTVGDERGGRPSGGLVADSLPYLATVVAVWLGWQIVSSALADRLPPALAIRLAPQSSKVLARAAEAEFAAKRFENANLLARDALAKAPFDVRALRVTGLTEAELGQREEADQMLTLAGNWSLRDDPAHAWLVEHRLRRGDYASAFAHADTLVRRRDDLQGQVFRLFTVAAVTDPQAFDPLAGLLVSRPPWRNDFLESLYRSPEGFQLAANLAIALEKGQGRFSSSELRQIYVRLMMARQFGLMQIVRERIGRPPLSELLINSDFSQAESPAPFNWELYAAAGIRSEIMPDGLSEGNAALRVDYDGYQTSAIAEQLIMLDPGEFLFSGRVRNEVSNGTEAMQWEVACRNGPVLVSTKGFLPSTTPQRAAWSTFSVFFTVPASPGCQAQTVRLLPLSGDHRSKVVTWFDDIIIRPRQGAGSRPAPGERDRKNGDVTP